MQESLSDKYKVHYFSTTDKNWSARLTQFNSSLCWLSVYLAPENWQLIIILQNSSIINYLTPDVEEHTEEAIAQQ
jgi:hypothetical protein